MMMMGRMINNLKSRTTTMKKLSIMSTFILTINCLVFVMLYYTQEIPPPNRILSTDLGNGQCLWEAAQPMGADVKAFGTLIASYPASGMRFTWQQTEGLTGIQVGDDFKLGGDGVNDKTGLVKTQYPHLEGIWSWGENMDQAILLVRNPRWALPSYHTLLSEIHYAHDWETAYKYLSRTFSMRPPLADWIKWRDYRFEDEIKLWRWHIDFWMEGGTQYWIDHDFERCGQWPFFFLNETDRNNWPRDDHCPTYMDCRAKAVVSYETLRGVATGPTELKKIANLIRGKEGFPSVIGDDAIQCIWEKTNEYKVLPDNMNRNYDTGPTAEEFTFTIAQYTTMKQNLQLMANKYSSGVWVENTQAQNLLKYFNSYINEVTLELDKLIASPPPTPAPNANRKKELMTWYNTLGRGNRYDKEKIQAMFSFWPTVKHLFEDAGENPYH